MYLRKGSHTHALNEASLSINIDFRNQPDGGPGSYVHRWSISGRLHADTTAALTTAIRALEAAYSTNTDTIVLLENDGTTETAHKLPVSGALAGVQVKRLSYPTGDGAQYTTFRDYEIEIEAEYLVGATQVAGKRLITYREAIRIKGTGGPRHVIRVPLIGMPQKRMVTQRTPVYATQVGSATSKGTYWTPAPPIWPNDEDLPERELGKDTDGDGNFTRNWSYSFSSIGPLGGDPTKGF